MTRYGLACLLVAIMAAAAVHAQQPEVVTSTERIGWDYADADLSTYQIDRFEVQWNAGAWTSVEIPPIQTVIQIPNGSGGQAVAGKTYMVGFPALTPGNHTVSVRACNADFCSGALGPFAFRLGVIPVDASNLRVIREQ